MIEHYSFEPPFHSPGVTDVQQNLDGYLLMAKKKQVVPPDHKRDITPPGYSDRWTLTTKVADLSGVEDTVGKVEQRSPSGKHREVDINEAQPLVVVARLNALNGGTGIRVDGLIRYVRSIGAQDEANAYTAANISFEIPVEEFVTIPLEMPVTEEAPIPVEIPHFDNVQR